MRRSEKVAAAVIVTVFIACLTVIIREDNALPQVYEFQHKMMLNLFFSYQLEGSILNKKNDDVLKYARLLHQDLTSLPAGLTYHSIKGHRKKDFEDALDDTDRSVQKILSTAGAEPNSPQLPLQLEDLKQSCNRCHAVFRHSGPITFNYEQGKNMPMPVQYAPSKPRWTSNGYGDLITGWIRYWNLITRKKEAG